MKKLLNRFSRVSDSIQYLELRSEARPRRTSTFLSLKRGRRSTPGSLPLCVGEAMERHVVSTGLLRNPIFIKLLEKSAEEYGYDQKGVLRIPCNVLVFETLIAAANQGEVITPEIQNLLDSI